MWNLDLYARLDLARCLGLHRPDQLVRLEQQPQGDVRPAGLHERRQSARGPHRHKNPERAMDLEHSPSGPS
jgi:hypothetical protein